MTCPICQGTSFEEIDQVKDHSITGEVFGLGRCLNCNFTLTLDPPSEESIGRYYKSDVYISHSDTRATFMDKVYHWVRSRMLERKASLIENYSSLKTGRLLDVGSGTGYFANHMVKKGWDVEGIEIDQAAREKSIAQFGLTIHPPTKIYTLDNGAYDGITMWHVLEHVKDLEGYLKAYYSALNDQGTLIIAVPNCASHDANLYKSFWAAYDVPRHLWHFTHKDMKALTGKYGFNLVDLKPMPWDAFYVSILSEKYQGSSLAMIRGAWRGLMSNIAAFGKPEKSSSIIYILKKKL